MSTTSRRLVPLLAAAALLLAACGGDTGAVADAEPDDTGSADAEMEGDVADVQVSSTELGDVLVDADGMTLYVFTNDSDGQSVCYDDCAAAWPPLTVGAEPVAGDGVDAELLGTTGRDDGAAQVTYDGWPLYTWAADSEPGDVTGQGVNDVWFVVAPDGEAIMGSEPAADAADY